MKLNSTAPVAHAALVASAAGGEHPRGDLLQPRFHVLALDRAVFAALNMEPQQVVTRHAVARYVRRVLHRLDVVAVAELPAEVLVEQRDAAVMLSMIVCSISRVLSTSRCAAAASALAYCSSALTLLELGDIAHRADDAAYAPVLVANSDAVLARPAPIAVARAEAEFADDARPCAL